MKRPEVEIYCDGSCSPNPGIGGWAAVLISRSHDKRKEIHGAEKVSTNNRMELTAAIMALRALKRPAVVTLHTDSKYLREPFEQGWIDKWQSTGWKTSDRKSVQNVDLWQELVALSKIHEIKWIWVKGHADNRENNRCDELANMARLQLANSA